jgi:predicted dehydrogenase
MWYVERLQAETQASASTPTLSANDKPGVALIGCGGQGRADAKNASRFGEVIAVCDVDESRAREAAKQFSHDGKTPQVYGDFRRLLERPDVHIIITGTPDHWHTLVNLAAVKAGKDIYGEKPLTLTIDEGKHLVAAVRKHKRIFQTGSQQRSDSRFRLACELVRNGRIGKLKTITVWLPAGLREGPFQATPTPKELNWDFWQGQTPKVDYVRQRCHLTFRFWYDYSGGTMTDWGAHHNDIALWAVGFPGPVSIEGKALAQPIPGGYTAISEYDVKFTYENGVEHRVLTTRDDSIYGGMVKMDGQRNGLKFEGSDGWIWVNRGALEGSTDELVSAPLPQSAERLYSSADHMGNFFDCVRSRKLPICDVAVGHRAASVCHMGNIALRTGLHLKWDAKKEKFAGENAHEGNRWLAREMRKPYDYNFV